ncbi:Succinyl-CoA:(R)-benzylsuccinate CoA-transferase subunit BbsF [Geodia barretti]|uniref:Succinyl-CoA:(R)-benzylsuccinate CoA-transferase subunit BbsF n=1 Tax=Geodia barretti TaxID=519541 RepID=A0AA35QSK9_GEOBA|nr:Succinyl-CoA:(R)-benzylsuccinate CoA-transferase subunit BbsF [Geodia barretti]
MMGAEVIKVGSARRPDPSTRGAPFQAYNQSKLYAALNISRPEGLELAMRLVSVSDVVIENFAAGVIERLGLGYDALRQAKPDIIMLSSSGTGHSGPDKDYVAYGSLLQYYTGWNAISGYPNSEPIKGGLWADPWVGMELAMVAAAALNHRAVTGEGNYVDFSMAEALTASIPEALLDYQMNDRVPELMGNADSQHCPHNVYRCKGSDRWLAIAVTSDEEWRALCGVIGWHDLSDDPSLADAKGRREQQHKIDAAITEWTQHHEDYEAMGVLQDAGIPAVPYLSPQRVFTDPQLREGGFFTTLTASRKEVSTMAVQYEKQGSIAYVTIDNPQKANILDRQTSDEMAEVWKEVWDDRDVRVAILTGKGDRHFCAGHNLATRPDITPEERERIRSEAIFWPPVRHCERRGANRC